MDTKKFRTRQERNTMTNPKGRDFIIGLDIGYSSTKVFYENGCFCFPSYVKKLENTMLNISDKKDIFYRDEETGETYMIGYNAQQMIESTDTNDTDGELYSRKRYGAKNFRILCNAAIGMALADKKDNRKPIIRTGLPSSYLSGDTQALKKALCTPARFSIKINRMPWVTYDLNLDMNDISVIAQPMGALYSVIIKNDGKYVQNAKDILTGNVLVLDIGFGTCDFIGLKNRVRVCEDSTDEIGMREVLSLVSKKILKDFNEDIRVAALQKNLETGTVICVNEDEMETEEKSIGNIVEESSHEVFLRAMEKAKSVTNAFRGYQYVIVDGGTGEAWYEDIKQWMSKMKTIQIIPCNINDHLPFIYSNARGYYMFGYMENSRRK